MWFHGSCLTLKHIPRIFSKHKIMADIASHIIVRGIVQGVGFRYFVFKHASELGLRGMVWNRSDGSVGIDIEGDHSLIDELIKTVRVGPRSSHVTDVSVAWRVPEYKFNKFDIG
jgi:acylphosphatase